MRIMETFPAYTWSELNDEDPAFLRAIMIRSTGAREGVNEGDESVGFDGNGDDHW